MMMKGFCQLKKANPQSSLGMSERERGRSLKAGKFVSWRVVSFNHPIVDTKVN